MPTDAKNFHLDKETFERIYRNHWKMVFGVCYRYLQDEDIASELVQDIFESLWRRKNVLQVNESIEKYLAGAAKLAVFNYIRSTKQAPVFCPIPENNYSTTAANPEDELHFNDLSQRITELAGVLPEKSRVVFEMSRTEGLSNKEIASELLVSENTVKYHISYATRFLKTGLKEFL